MKTPGAVLLLLWAALVVVAAESGDGSSENDIFDNSDVLSQFEAEMGASVQQAVPREMRSLGAELRNTKAQMMTMETRLKANEKTMMTMKTRLKANEKTMMTMKTRLKANEKTMMTMKTRLRANEKLVQRLMHDIEVSAVNVNLPGSQVEELRREREERRVAFSASLITSGHLTLGPFNEPATTLIYRNVITNIGNAYNNNTGIFTAPVRGVYHFAIFVYGFGHVSKPTGAALRKNGEHVVIAYSHLPSGRASASNAASLLLEVGDQVSVVLWETNAWVRDSYNHHTSFSGHLLFPM
ncbi:uncharacterized protein LOC134064181 [Sardina pilchardus]|uniref:uncharacterized protein LOC134064181 n=1 Tax=Sardina pilchardus TaxID=27697 RepID=UPI002E136631